VFPIGDDNSDITIFPWVTYALIIANVLVFVIFQGLGSNDHFTYAFSVVPEEILKGMDIDKAVAIYNPVTGVRQGTIDLQPTPIPVYLTLITSMFMHGGFAHIFGNMVFLHVFGDNLENVMGHLKFFAFYMICGIFAGLSQVYTTEYTGGNLYVPTLGASGAISGVLGGYVFLFPNRKVRVIMMRMITDVPAYVALGIWILFQLAAGFGVFGAEEASGGVAYAAHIGGFAAGLVAVTIFANKDRED